MRKKKKYVVVGSGSRAYLFIKALTSDYKNTTELSAFCDINQTRMDFHNRQIGEEDGHPPVPTYLAYDFDRMIKEIKPDVVIVCTIDRIHHEYIIRAMELGCDVITEKPMTTDEEKCQEIIDAVKRTGKKLRVCFNYRYAPHNSIPREYLKKGVIGNINSVHFEWLLNTKHGADYFRRWHRDKKNSGGLLVHKSTHHFDLVNFWLGTSPKTVFAFGDLMFYGRINAEKRGVKNFYYRSTGNEFANNDGFGIDISKGKGFVGMYWDAEKEDGYLRDQSVFGDGISIEDTMGVIVRYKSKAIMTYSLNAYMPWEGYRVSFNGDKGRMEMEVIEKSYVNAGGDRNMEGAVKGKKLIVYPMFDKPYSIPLPDVKGGHGGGDIIMAEEIFAASSSKTTGFAADHVDGAMSILTGIAANKSIQTGMPVDVDSLVKF
ncbi:MAG TPA: Gfo/Idh/MocA family oxidoreductase [Victivallales bacterium]|nr:Gfo/Idh/MocA family oxidoreductase [Victivallales bacterium]